MLDFKHILTVSIILFSVIDILGSVPIVIDLRKKYGKIYSGKATIIAGTIMIVFLFVGESILSFMGLDIGSFAVAGSVVIFLIGLEMVLGTEIFKSDTSENTSASIVPLAFPMIAGAGTLTTLLSLRAEFHELNITIGILLNLAFIYLALKMSTWMERKIGQSGFNVLRKVFGIILLAIAIKLFKNNWFL